MNKIIADAITLLEAKLAEVKREIAHLKSERLVARLYAAATKK